MEKKIKGLICIALVLCGFWGYIIGNLYPIKPRETKNPTIIWHVDNSTRTIDNRTIIYEIDNRTIIYNVDNSTTIENKPYPKCWNWTSFWERIKDRRCKKRKS